MRIVNLGSLNIDYVYRVQDIVSPGETTAALSRDVFSGGKGLNQSVALGRAGAKVFHAGLVGEEKAELLDVLESSGVDISLIKQCAAETGHAVIQVDNKGQNSIIVFGGANKQITADYISEALSDFREGDLLLLQNEISCVGDAMEHAARKGMTIAFNPSPFTENINDLPLDKVKWLILNKTEGTCISGEEDSGAMIRNISARYPDMSIVITLGSEGSVCFDGENTFTQKSYKVDAVDTTGAGDTFTGYFIASAAEGRKIPEALRTASAAAALSVMTKGAAVSIPYRDAVNRFFRDENICDRITL